MHFAVSLDGRVGGFHAGESTHSISDPCGKAFERPMKANRAVYTTQPEYGNESIVILPLKGEQSFVQSSRE